MKYFFLILPFFLLSCYQDNLVQPTTEQLDVKKMDKVDPVGWETPIANWYFHIHATNIQIETPAHPLEYKWDVVPKLTYKGVVPYPYFAGTFEKYLLYSDVPDRWLGPFTYVASPDPTLLGGDAGVDETVQEYIIYRSPGGMTIRSDTITISGPALAESHL